MQHGKKGKQKTRRASRKVIGIVVAALVMIAAAVCFFVFFNPFTQTPEKDEAAIAQERADFATKSARNELSDDELNRIVEGLSTDQEKADTLGEFAVYTLAQEDVSNEAAQKALTAAQRAYDLDNKVAHLWVVHEAALKLGQDDKAAETLETINGRLEGQMGEVGSDE